MSQGEETLVFTAQSGPPNGAGERTVPAAPPEAGGNGGGGSRKHPFWKRWFRADPAQGKESLAGLGAVLGVAATLIAGVFAALGVSGNLLARMVRNNPGASRNVLIAAIVAVVLIAVVTAVRQIPNAWIVVPIAGLGLALGFAADVAADSQGSRDQPAVSLSLGRLESGGLEVTAKATGSGLRPYERMLLRLTTIAGLGSPGELRQASDAECRRMQMHASDPARARVLLWTETGPNETGGSAVEQKAPVPAEAQYLCAWVVVAPRFDRDGILTPATPQNIALVDVRGLGGTASTPSTPSTGSTG
jgi:hypothetical protein